MVNMQNQVNEILKSASKIKNFPVAEASLHEVGRLLYENRAIDLWDIYYGSEEYIRVVIGIVEALRRRKLLSAKKEQLHLTPKGRVFFKELLQKELSRDFITDIEPIRLNKRYKKILTQVKQIYKKFTAKDKFDQAPLMPDAAVKKVAYAIQKGDIVGRSVVCVGDDDFTSIILALTGLPKEVLAVDLDKEVLGLIEEHSKKFKVPVKTLHHDLRKPIPKAYQGKYDTFISEPPDTVLGFTMFVSRGIELLKKKPGYVGYAGVTQTACPPLGMLKIQETLTRMGVIIVGYIPKFSTYPSIRTELKQVYVPEYVEYPPTKPWYISDLVRLKTTKATKPLYKTVTKKIAWYRRDAMTYR
ncbi:MAG: bis-aminopropyl spermidine synthase family protein [Nanoarchaeota archaeon]